jgi:hypothetical protein
MNEKNSKNAPDSRHLGSSHRGSRVFTAARHSLTPDLQSTRKRSKTVNANKRSNVKMLAAIIGGSAIVAMGAVTTAISQEDATPTSVASSGMSMGETTKQATPPSVPETSIAVPTVKAVPFGGSGS